MRPNGRQTETERSADSDRTVEDHPSTDETATEAESDSGQELMKINGGQMSKECQRNSGDKHYFRPPHVPRLSGAVSVKARAPSTPKADKAEKDSAEKEPMRHRWPSRDVQHS